MPLIIIASVVGVIGAGLLGWQIWKSTALGIPVWLWGVGALGLLVLFLGSNTGKQATQAAGSITKVYLTKGLLKNPC